MEFILALVAFLVILTFVWNQVNNQRKRSKKKKKNGRK